MAYWRSLQRRVPHLLTGTKPEPPRLATRDLEHRERGLIAADVIEGVRRCLFDYLLDAPASIDEDHVERDVGVLHPHADVRRLGMHEQHAAVGRQGADEHQPRFLLVGRLGDLYGESMDTARRADRQRHASKPRLRGPLFCGSILGRSLRAARRERDERERQSSETPEGRSSTAVSPLALGAIRASTCCPGWSSPKCAFRTVSMCTNTSSPPNSSGRFRKP